MERAVKLRILVCRWEVRIEIDGDTYKSIQLLKTKLYRIAKQESTRDSEFLIYNKINNKINYSLMYYLFSINKYLVIEFFTIWGYR